MRIPLWTHKQFRLQTISVGILPSHFRLSMIGGSLLFLFSQRSSGSLVGSSSKDRPWRTASSMGGSGGYDNGHNSTADAAEGNEYNNVPRTTCSDESASARSNSSSSAAPRTEGGAVTVSNVVTPTRFAGHSTRRTLSRRNLARPRGTPWCASPTAYDPPTWVKRCPRKKSQGG